MNIAIVDDEQNEIDSFQSVIKEYSSMADTEITVSAFHSAEDFIKGYSPLAYTAIFMDIFMSGMTGVDAARKILEADRHAIIIFLTSSDGFMGDALSIHAYDYIEKPAEKTRIFKVMDDVLMKKTEYDSTPRLTFTSDRQNYSIPCPDIMYIRTAERNYLEIMQAPGRPYKARLSFAGVQSELSNDKRFITITRPIYKALSVAVLVFAFMSFIVNIANGFDAELHPHGVLNNFSLEAAIFQAMIATLFTILVYRPVSRKSPQIIDGLDMPRVYYASVPIWGIFLVFNLLISPRKYETIHVNLMQIAYWGTLIL
ncbi:MAG: response regulator [Lachnospiraceae bacterium]|nr:response regulator [Lachnospiraceae bacterium]